MSLIYKSHLFKMLILFRSFILYYFYFFKNKKIDYFDFKKLSINFPIFNITNDPGLIGNKVYGNLYVIKKYLKNDFNKNCLIEHGIYFGQYIIKNEIERKDLKIIYTYGKYRLDVLKKILVSDNIEIKLLGPYIKYAKNFKSSNDLNKIKQKFRKILLVFPVHSVPDEKKIYNINSFIDEIKEVSKNYDTVLVSMFWLDIVKENHLLYEKAGFQIVCAGTRSDPYFLSRLKDLIHLSDMTISNYIGTHIGYCISLSKPHYLFKQDVQFLEKSLKVTDNFDSNYYKILENELKVFQSVFSSPLPLITKEQTELVEYYWGK
jgi:hypothetical protein